MTVERTTEQRDITDLSASRINLAQKCGLAFKYNYIDHLPQPTESAAAIFGSGMHAAVEIWYGGSGPITEDNAHVHKDLDLVDLMDQQWPDRLPPRIWLFVKELAELDSECDAVASAIQFQRPQLKAPRQTVAFQNSDASKQFQEKKSEMLGMLAKFEEIRWPNDEDPYKAFLKARELAARLQKEWQPLPRPLLVEEPFRLEFEGFVLRGAIDQVRRDPDLITGEMKPPEVNDLKTGRQLMTQMEAFTQAWTYNVACREIELAPNDMNDFAFTFARHVDQQGRTKVQRGSIDRKRHDKLALRILNGVGRKIITGQHEPHYGTWCKQCDYKDVCEQELQIWEGDGVLMTV